MGLPRYLGLALSNGNASDEAYLHHSIIRIETYYNGCGVACQLSEVLTDIHNPIILPIVPATQSLSGLRLSTNNTVVETTFRNVFGSLATF